MWIWSKHALYASFSYRHVKLDTYLKPKIIKKSQQTFDTVHHKKLLIKWKAKELKYGKWLHENIYHNNIYQMVKTDLSDSWEIKCGVPQGSIFGPILHVYVLQK